jgi:hypothetical protein
MLKNLIDSELTKENEDLSIQNIRSTEALLPFLLNLSTDERRRLYKLGRDGLDFAEKSLMHAADNPELVASFMDIPAMQKDLKLMKQVQRVLGVTESFCEKLRDTYMVLGAEVYDTARVFYRTVKNAAVSGAEGCDYIARDLGDHYKNLAKPKAKKEEKAENNTENQG